MQTFPSDALLADGWVMTYDGNGLAVFSRGEFEITSDPFCQCYRLNRNGILLTYGEELIDLARIAFARPTDPID